MTLRRRILLIIGVTLVALIVGLYGVSSSILLKDFARLERRDVASDVRRLQSAVGNEVANLNAEAAEWAEWDDTYQFIQDRNKNYIRSNLNETMLANVRLNLVVFLNREGQVVWSKGLDLRTEKATPITESFLGLLKTKSALAEHPNTASVRAGVLLLPEGVTLVVSRPIVTSQRTGPVRGTLILGRFLDAMVMKRLADTTHLTTTVWRVDDPKLPADFRQAWAMIPNAKTVYVHRLQGDLVGGYTLWNDVFGKPALLLRVEMPREIFAQGQATIRYLVTLLLVIGLCFGGGMMVLMERLVLRRLARLIADVDRIGTSSDVTARVATVGRDEMAGLAKALNKMLDAVQHSQGNLQESQRQLFTLMANLPGLVYRCRHDEDWVIEFASEGCFELTGYHPQDLVNNNTISYKQLIHPDDRDRVCREVLDAVAAGRPYQLQYSITTAQGKTRCVWEQGRGVAPPNGKVEFLEGFISDVTQQKLAADRLRLQGTALESAANAIVLTDRDGVIEWVNPAFTKLTGYTFSEAYGERLSILKSGRHEPAFYEELWQTILAGEVWHGELINRRKDGALYTERMTIAPVTNDRGEVAHFIAIKEDITEQKRLQEQFLQAQKVEAVGRLAGGVAHDFNNILTAISGYTELLLRKLAANDPLFRLAEQIRKSTERASGLTRQLLAFSRKQALQPRVLDLSNVVTDIEKMLRRLIGEDIELHTIRGAAVGNVKADPAQVEQVIMNLAVNARDAMPKGGKLIIEVARATLSEEYTRRYRDVQPGEYVMLAVTDTGTGMTEEVKAHIFEPFFTTKPQGKGTGLGLATCYGIVKQSGGHISVHSELGRGTTFKIYLPRVDADVDPRPERPKLRELPTGRETILVAEDEPRVRELTVDILRNLGYQVIEAGSGEEGVRLAQEKPNQKIDLLFTDVVMPQMDGKQLADWFGTARPETKVLFTSGYTADAIIRHGIFEDRIAFLEKPFTPEVLAQRVRDVLDADAVAPAVNEGSAS
jgi:PAS domain S-box-containing protein